MKTNTIIVVASICVLNAQAAWEKVDYVPFYDRLTLLDGVTMTQ